MYKRTFKAFTLPEILISLSVIIILSAVLLPSLAGARQRAAQAAAVKTLSTLREKSEVLIKRTTGLDSSSAKVYQSELCTVGFNQDLQTINNRLGYGLGGLSTTVASEISTTNISVNNSTSCFEKKDATAWFVITDIKQKGTEKELFCTDYTGFAGIIQQGYLLEDWQCDADGDELVYGTGLGYFQGKGALACDPLKQDCKKETCKKDPITGKCITSECEKDPITGKYIDPDPTTPVNECDPGEKSFKSGFESYVRGIVIVPGDGGTEDTIVGAEKDGVTGALTHKLRKLKANGTIDATFDTNSGTAVRGDMHFGGMARLADGRYLVPQSGTSSVIGPYTQMYNENGTKNATFTDNTGSVKGGANAHVAGVLQMPNSAIAGANGDIILYGHFTGFTGTTADSTNITNNIARFDSDGKFSSIQFIGGGGSSKIHVAIVDKSNGKVTAFAGNSNTEKIIRWNANGALDTTFGGDGEITMPIDIDDPLTTTVVEGILVTSVDIDEDGNYYIGHMIGAGIFKLNSSGVIISTFTTNVGTGAKKTSDSDYGTAVKIQKFGSGTADDKILVGGSFDKFNGVSAGRLVRLNQDGTRDTGFDNKFGTGPGGDPKSGKSTNPDSVGLFIRQVLVDTRGNIFLSGEFTTMNGEDTPWAAKLFSDGTVYPDSEL